MKKILLILTVVLTFNVFGSVYASSLNNEIVGFSEESVSCVYLQSLNDNQRSGNEYNYMTTDPNEIKYFLHLLSSFNAERGEVPFIYDSGFMVRITHNDEEKHIVLWEYGIHVNNDHEYWIDEYEYERFLEAIKALKNRQMVLNDMTTEASIWAKDDINIAEKEFVPKWNQFNYSESVNRLEVCQIIGSCLKKKIVSNCVTDLAPFEDVNDNDVSLLYSLNIVNGKSEFAFAPYDFITREEMAKILSNLWHYINPDLVIEVEDSNYNDCDEISEWAKAYVDEMSTIGILKGDDNGNFAPQRHMTKEEVIVSLMRLFELKK